MKKLLKLIRPFKIKIGKKTKIVFVKDRPGHDFKYSLNSEKIYKQIKWRPKIKIDDGLKDTIKWYLTNKIFLRKISKKLYEKRLGLSI